jgi:hypothetical protein
MGASLKEVLAGFAAEAPAEPSSSDYEKRRLLGAIRTIQNAVCKADADDDQATLYRFIKEAESESGDLDYAETFIKKAEEYEELAGYWQRQAEFLAQVIEEIIDMTGCAIVTGPCTDEEWAWQRETLNETEYIRYQFKADKPQRQFYIFKEKKYATLYRLKWDE